MKFVTRFALGLFLAGGVLSMAQADTHTSTGSAPPFRFSHPTDSSPLAHSHILALAQDRQGFMWFGTELAGLCRYDGYECRIYQHDPDDHRSLAHNYIVALYVDRAGTLWIGFNGGGMDRYDPKTDSFVHYQNDPKDTNSMPHSSVWGFLETRSGAFWIGGGSGLSRFDRQSGAFFNYHHDENDPNSLADDSVRVILEDTDGMLWLGTRRGGLDCLNPATGRFSHYSHDPQNTNSLNGAVVNGLIKDSAGNLWIATEAGLDYLDLKTKTFTHHVHDARDPDSVIGDNVLRIYVDSQGRFWLATTMGLDRLDSDSGKFIHYSHERGIASTMSDNYCSSVFEDDAGGMWFGTAAGGVNRLAADSGQFAVWQHNPNDDSSLVYNAPMDLLADRKGNLWITSTRGLDVFDGRAFQHYLHNPDDPQSLSSDTTSAAAEDGQGTIWVGAGGALNRFDGAGFTHFAPPSPANGIAPRINSICADKRGRLWFSQQSVGLACFDGQRFTTYPMKDNDPHTVPSRYIYPMFCDEKGFLWMGCADMGLFRLDPENGEFTTYLLDPSHPGMEVYNRVYAICPDSNGGFWVGANQGLFYFDTEKKSFTRHYTKDVGLPANTVTIVRRDRLGRLWLGTPAGLCRFDPQSKRINNYDESDGLPSAEFHRDIATVMPDGRMFLCGANGLIGFYPEQLRDNPHVPPVVLTGFELFDKPVPIDAKNSPLHQAINLADTIRLKYDQLVLAFQFAALDYTAPDKNRYEYKLEGFDKGWRQTDAGRPFASYTKLPAGHYVFRVRGSNNDGLWNEKGVALNLIIAPAWWATWWFRSLLAAILLALSMIAFKYRVRSLEISRRALELQVAQRTRALSERSTELLRAKEEVETVNRSLEEKVNARTAELTAANSELQREIAERMRAEEQFRQAQKMEAFGQLAAGVAHDFNNILTVIQGNLSLVLAGGLRPADQSVALDHTFEAAERAAALTRQLLTFGRRRPFQPADIDLNEVVDRILKMLRRIIGEHIMLETQYAAGGAPVHADPGMLEQVLLNLAVNARDAMPDGGKLTLETRRVSFGEDVPANSKRRAGDFISLSVRDTGHGITAEHLPRIFEPFFTTKEVGRGTGLGLATVFGIVEQHHGWIEVDSRLDSGTAFHIFLPHSSGPCVPVGKALNSIPVRGGKETILIAEDELPVRDLMVETLSHQGYRVYSADSGAVAVELWKTFRDSVDLLITDMVMPGGISGRELAERLRSDKPELKVIYCSGYTDDVLGRDSLLRSKVNFLDKPFALHKFLETVRHCLDNQ